MKRLAAGVSLAILLRGAELLACPACAPSAGGTGSDGGGIWTIVGVFLLVPPLIATAIILAMRREYRNVNAETTAATHAG
ncbi:MAG: hypothetical protein ABIT01_02630 [Thermoanaerobaculia bacterium]